MAGQEINDKLVEVWNLFSGLAQTHPDHVRYFRDGIHACQQVMMWRELQEINTEKYPKFGSEA